MLPGSSPDAAADDLLAYLDGGPSLVSSPPLMQQPE